MRKILFALALAVVATACHDNEEQSVQMGKIDIIAATRSEVGNATSSNSIFLSSAPSAKDLKVEIEGNGKVLRWDTFAEFEKAIEEGLLFTSAPYTITLSHGEKGVEGWSKPYFEGKTSVEVPGYELTVKAEVEVVLANSIVAVATNDNFKGYFPQATFKINGIEWDSSKTEHLFMNAGEVTITCDAVSQRGSTSHFSKVVTLKPTTRHTVLFELTAGNASVTISFDDKIVATEELEFDLNENA